MSGQRDKGLGELMKTKPSAVLFVMWHKSLDRQHFTKSLDGFQGDIIFLKAGAGVRRTEVSDHSSLNEHDLVNCDPSLQSRGFMAGSILTNVFRSGLYKKYSHIGFVEYDIRFPMLSEDRRTVELLNSLISSKSQDEVVSFSTQRTLRELHNQTEIKIGGQNAIEWLHARLIGGAGTPLVQLLDQPAITQQSFFTSTTLFDRVMSGIDELTLDGSFERKMNTWHRPSTLFERAVAVQLANSASSIVVSDAKHFSEHGWSDLPNRHNWLRYLANYLRRRWNRTRFSSSS